MRKDQSSWKSRNRVLSQGRALQRKELTSKELLKVVVHSRWGKGLSIGEGDQITRTGMREVFDCMPEKGPLPSRKREPYAKKRSVICRAE